MKASFTFILLWVLVFELNAQTLPTLHSYSVVTIYGDTISLAKYYGKR